MNYFYGIPSIYQATDVIDASTSSSSTVNAWNMTAADSPRMPQYVRTMIAPSLGEVSVVNPIWNSVPVEVIQQEPFSPSAVGDIHINWLETMDAHVIKADVPGTLRKEALLDILAQSSARPMSGVDSSNPLRSDSSFSTYVLQRMRRQDLQVLVEGGPVLQISGERFETWPFDIVNRRQVERWIGGFMRRFRLPDNVVIDRISAELDLGVLTITIPKLQRFPSVQWFIPVRTIDSGRPSQAAGSLTDAFPPLRASNISSNGRSQLTNGQDQGQSRPMPARDSLVELDENSWPSNPRASHTRTSGASSRANSASSRDSRTEEDARESVTADEVPSPAADLESERESAREPEATDGAQEEPEGDEDIEEAVRMVLENMVQALEADQNVTTPTKSSNQSRRNSKRISTNSLSEGSRTAQRRASQITNAGTTNHLTPPATAASTKELLETLGNAIQRKISWTSNRSGTADHDEREDRELRTTSSRSSRRASQTTEDNLQGRNSQTFSEKDTQPIIDQDAESGTAGSGRLSRRPSQSDEHALQGRSSQDPPPNAPQINSSQDIESGSSRSGSDSTQASSTDENAVQRKNSRSLTENNTEPNIGQDMRSRPEDSRRPLRRAYTEVIDTKRNLTETNTEPNVGRSDTGSRPADSRRLRRAYTEIIDTKGKIEASVPIENSPGISGNAWSTRISQSGENETEKGPNATEKALSEEQVQSSRKNSHSSRRNSLGPKQPPEETQDP